MLRGKKNSLVMGFTTFHALVSFGLLFNVVTIDSQEVNDRQRRCGVNEIRDWCGIMCEDRCNAARPDFCLGNVQCGYTGCRCRDGYSRNPYNQQCVPNAECPVDGCARGEIFAACGKACEGTCSNSLAPAKCLTMPCLDWACRCDGQGGFVRNQRLGTCARPGDPCNKLEDYKDYNNGFPPKKAISEHEV